MRNAHRLAASLLGLITTACAVSPTMIVPATKGNDPTAIRSLALSETASLMQELGVTGDAVTGSAVTPDDLTTLDRNGDHKVDRTEIANYYVQALQEAGGAGDEPPPPAVGPVPGTLPTGALPQFFVNTTPQPNETKLLVDEAEIFPEMLDLIHNAKTRIQVDYFLLGGDIGLTVARALVERAGAGIDVDIMLDPKLGVAGPTAVNVARVTDYLKQNKVNFKLYPLNLYGTMPNAVQKRFQIDHNKLLIVDSNKALMGSMNIDDGARMNHDIMVRIVGPTAAELSHMLDVEWPMGYDPNKPTPTMQTKAVESEGTVRLTETAPQERTTKGLLLREIDAAQRSIHVHMYEFGDPDITAALAQAYKRGVDVRVIMDPKATNAKYGAGIVPDNMPNALPARELLKVGAQVRWYVPQRVNQEAHMKMVVFDGTKAIAGSTNWTTNAFTRWRETSFELQGQTAQDMEALWQRNWDQRSKRIDKLSIKQRIVARIVDYMNRHDLAFW